MILKYSQLKISESIGYLIDTYNKTVTKQYIYIYVFFFFRKVQITLYIIIDAHVKNISLCILSI